MYVPKRWLFPILVVGTLSTSLLLLLSGIFVQWLLILLIPAEIILGIGWYASIRTVIRKMRGLPGRVPKPGMGPADTTSWNDPIC